MKDEDEKIRLVLNIGGKQCESWRRKSPGAVEFCVLIINKKKEKIRFIAAEDKCDS